MKKFLSNYKSTIILLVAIIVGAIVGIIFQEKATILSPLGDIFLNLLLVIIVPLIFLTITTSITKMKTPKRLGKIVITIICIFLVIYYWQNIITAMSKFITVANPLIVGAMIAYILNIIMKFYEKKLFSKTKNKNILKYKRGISILLSMTSIVVILILIARLIIPELKS